jgi:hypothetical protein
MCEYDFVMHDSISITAVIKFLIEMLNEIKPKIQFPFGKFILASEKSGHCCNTNRGHETLGLIKFNMLE